MSIKLTGKEAADLLVARTECRWERQALSLSAEYDSWCTSCGEDYAIEEEWHDSPPNFCQNCGGRVVDVAPEKKNV